MQNASFNCFSGMTSWVETALFLCKFACLKPETFPARQAALETLRSEMSDKEKSLKKEIETLKKAGRDRERDLDTLNTVLQCNQDVINVRTHTHTHVSYYTVYTSGLCHKPLSSHLKLEVNTPAMT